MGFGLNNQRPFKISWRRMSKKTLSFIFTLLFTVSFAFAGAKSSKNKASPLKKTKPMAEGSITEFVQGGEAWGVYIAVDKPGSKSLKSAETTVANLPVAVKGGKSGDLNCDIGAAEALGYELNQEYQAVVTYFQTEESAKKFASTLKTPPKGIFKVNTGCAD